MGHLLPLLIGVWHAGLLRPPRWAGLHYLESQSNSQQILACLCGRCQQMLLQAICCEPKQYCFFPGSRCIVLLEQALGLQHGMAF